MSEKRRDSKGRILRTGESQRKDGRYAYKYVNKLGKEQFVYAWKLVNTDKIPIGKRDGLPLREKIKNVKRDIEDGIIIGKKTIVLELVRNYLMLKVGIAENTKKNYEYVVVMLEKSKIGYKKIEDVKIINAKQWFVELKEKGYAYSTLDFLKRIIKASFWMAMQDDFIRKNPFDFVLRDIIKKDAKKQKVLSVEEEERFLKFIRTDRTYSQYYDEIIVLLRTGVRISEFCGLTVSDIDFVNENIRVNGQLEKEKGIYAFKSTKSDSGIRLIPIVPEIEEPLKRIIKNRKKPKVEVVGEKRDFLFINNRGSIQGRHDYNQLFYAIVKKYNAKHTYKLPNITPHILRHTFCTRLANLGVNPKALQYVMGHANVTLTLEVYAHVTYENASNEFKRVIA